ncbi:MAG: Cof-type HAD-IIB family hydrolase [Gemmataceae bacterium]|nr:Cof-type HAD-IIB family hydrolase [Gemmataceae bacterium]
MRYHILATDYDGTLAHDGVVDAQTVQALERARAAGCMLVMVTGRELAELLTVCPRLDLFTQVVVENGALLYRPDTRQETVLCAPPPEALVRTLREREVEHAVGRVIVATTRPHDEPLAQIIRELGLDWQVIYNKESVMALPAGVNKATGLALALTGLGVSPEGVVGVGDAENDLGFLELCGCGVAVANALPAVKERADLVMQGARGLGVIELIERMLADDMPPITRQPRALH